MQTVKTIPGKTYAVESAGEVIITNKETGAIAAQGDGSGQVLFTACANSYTLSDDAAKIVALFKSAPRLRLALLQGGAGGWLPKGFTELEYLESSGTQNICVKTPDLQTSGETWHQEVDNQFLSSGAALIGWNTSACLYWGQLDEKYSLGSGTGFAADGERHQFGYTCKALSDTYSFEATLSYDGQTARRAGYPSAVPSEWLYGLFVPNAGASGYAGAVKIWSCKCWCDSVRYALVPVLNADGEPGMWDKVSKQFYGNTGSGTFGYRIKGSDEAVAPMSLRDPYYVAPSGVYARLSGKNALEILADTEETSGDGWEWFANTAEASAHFGIVPQEEEFLTE